MQVPAYEPNSRAIDGDTASPQVQGACDAQGQLHHSSDLLPCHTSSLWASWVTPGSLQVRCTELVNELTCYTCMMVLVNPHVMLSYLASEQEDGPQASLQWRAMLVSAWA